MTALAIQAQFTQAADNAEFPDFNNGYYYPVDARLHLMRDPGRWAMVVELLGYNPRGGNLLDVVHTFGNCLTSGEPGFGGDGGFLERVENMDEAENDEETYTGTYTGAGFVVRGRRLLVDAPTGTPMEQALRLLVPAHRDLLLADTAELYRRLPGDLPVILTLDEWRHPEGLMDDFADEVDADETFRMLAEVLETGDTARYRPQRAPNTHWSNWPEAGTL
ncbi:hypothetical protein [Catenulispora sp. GAS73]|uniref:DUF7003 family protein n=1 Tax=Catenulispora sp. GAS73 TaxID=3156269 RepID=UPI003518E028